VADRGARGPGLAGDVGIAGSTRQDMQARHGSKYLPVPYAFRRLTNTSLVSATVPR